MSSFNTARKIGRKFQNPIETQVGGLGMMLKVMRLYLTNTQERVPKSPLGPFRTDLSIYQSDPPTGLRITWMGHSSMLIEIDGVRVLVDPVWDERASPVSWAGPKRFFAAPLPLAALPAIDVVLISHDHYDHLGKQTMRQLAYAESAASARWVTSLGVGAELEKLGITTTRIAELNWTQSIQIADKLTITSLPARHFSGRSLGNRFETLWASFVLQGFRHKLYFGADSGLWDGFREIGRQYGPFDVTMLEVGAWNELWKSIHLGPDGAAEAFSAMGKQGLLMPIHWGLFDLALHSWRAPIQRICELADREGFKLWSPEPGKPCDLVKGEQLRSDWWRTTLPPP